MKQQNNKKYFKRSDLLAMEQKTINNPNSSSSVNNSSNTTLSDDLIQDNTQVLPRAEVIKKLRERVEPILLFAETEIDSFKRLRKSEILTPEINKVHD